MIELTLADTARAIRPFLPDLAGPAAADLDRQLVALLAADADEDVEDQLAVVLGSLKLAGWTTYFLEHGEPPRSWGDGRRIVVRGHESHDPIIVGAESFAVGQPPGNGADEASSANALAYPRLDAPGGVAPGVIFTVTVGLRADADGALVSMGPMDLPADIELQVAVQFDPIAFVLVNPSSTETLRRTPDDPWPSAEFRFVALAGKELLAERRIGVKFLRNGQVVGFASRALVVRSAGDVAAGSTASSPSAVVTAARTRDPAAEGLDLREFADDEIDLLLLVQRSADVAGARLVFTAHSRHTDIEDQTKPATEELKGESKSGTTPQQIGQEARLKVATTGDGEDLFVWLTGLGVRVFRSLPVEIRAAVRAAVAKGTAGAPARILLFSEEPYVPWELAVDPEGWPSDAETTAPFLGAHAAIGRWFLGEVPPPKPRPVPSMDVREKALVSAHYDGIAGVMKWGALPEAEAEVENLAAFLAPDVAIVPPDLHDVLKLLDGTPPADLMHFALHGNFDPLAIQGGLILLRTDSGKTTAQNLQENHVIGKRLGQEPFVYLNACQVATGSSVTFGGYGGLAAAFLTAGAKGVLAPLWNIQDGTASALASEFYRLAVGDERLPAAEILRRFRARYTPEAVGGGEPNANATLIAFQLFGHPGLRLFPEAARAPELSHG
jgi:CHAT domain